MEGRAGSSDSTCDVQGVVDVGSSDVVLAPLGRVLGCCERGCFEEEGGVGAHRAGIWAEEVGEGVGWPRGAASELG